MKILQLNCVYGNGSTGKLVESNSRILRSKGHEVFTCYGNGPDYDDGHSLRVTTQKEHLFNAALSRITGIPFGGLFKSNNAVLEIISQFKPDIIHVHCINGHSFNVYKLLRDIAKTQIKTVVTLHAEFFHTGSCTHACDCEQWKTKCQDCKVYKYETASLLFNRVGKAWKLMHDAFASFNPKNLVISAVSPWLAGRARQSSILKNFRVEYVPNGVNTEIFTLTKPIDLDIFKHKAKTIIFVTPFFSLTNGNLKGGYYLPQIATKLPEYNFLVVASNVSDVDYNQLPQNLKIWGKAKDQHELARLYNSASATILLSLRETFSMVTAESLCCGTPVVGFKAGGPESITLADYSDFVEQGDINQLIDKLKKMINRNPDSSDISKAAAVTYSEKAMAEQFLNVYKSI